MFLARLVYHPLLGNKKSRSILVIFLALALGVSLLLWYRILGVLHAAGLSLNVYPLPDSWLISFMVSKLYRFSLVAVVALFTAALTSSLVLGPAGRILQWLTDWEAGYKVKNLRIRSGSHYDALVDLINELYERSQKK